MRQAALNGCISRSGSNTGECSTGAEFNKAPSAELRDVFLKFVTEKWHKLFLHISVTCQTARTVVSGFFHPTGARAGSEYIPGFTMMDVLKHFLSNSNANKSFKRTDHQPKRCLKTTALICRMAAAIRRRLNRLNRLKSGVCLFSDLIDPALTGRQAKAS